MDFLAENFLCYKFASFERTLAAQLPVFHLCSMCNYTIILGDLLKMDMVSNFLSLITVQEIGVREAERKKTQTSEKAENTSKPCFKN